MTKRRSVIVNADDFGASVGINRGIVRAHRSGPVTSTSLMVNMPAAGDAVARARDVPDLAVGTHVNFTNEGDPVVDLDDLSACRSELHRQLELFESSVGRVPTHVDSHHNVHLHDPALGEVFDEVGRQLGVPVRGRSGIPYVSRFYGQWDGESHPEQISAESMLRILDEEAGHDLIEFACHPGYHDPRFVSVYHRERAVELQTLCSPELVAGLRQRQIVLVSFADVVRGQGGRWS